MYLTVETWTRHTLQLRVYPRASLWTHWAGKGERQKELLFTAGETQTRLATMEISMEVSIALIKYHGLKQSISQTVTEGNQGRDSR